ncbi:MAG TPA: chloride channel protein [Solirubrobacteraceae bacterium]|nr:chloride channel protein [Solirubrobacteraceae bacterium]
MATTLTLSIGGSGGVFAPSLFMGAMVGSAYGTGVHALLPGLTSPAGAYGLVGMAGVFAAAARAPITAVLIIFELTGDYSVILPLMLATALATGVAHLVSGEETIYTLKLRRRGIDIMRREPTGAMQTTLVGEAMGRVPAGADPLTPVGRVGHETPELHSDESLEAGVAAFARTDDPGLPVLGPSGGLEVVGWITHGELLRAYHRAVSGERDAAGSPGAGGAGPGSGSDDAGSPGGAGGGGPIRRGSSGA